MDDKQQQWSSGANGTQFGSHNAASSRIEKEGAPQGEFVPPAWQDTLHNWNHYTSNLATPITYSAAPVMYSRHFPPAPTEAQLRQAFQNTLPRDQYQPENQPQQSAALQPSNFTSNVQPQNFPVVAAGKNCKFDPFKAHANEQEALRRKLESEDRCKNLFEADYSNGGMVDRFVRYGDIATEDIDLLNKLHSVRHPLWRIANNIEANTKVSQFTPEQKRLWQALQDRQFNEKCALEQFHRDRKKQMQQDLEDLVNIGLQYQRGLVENVQASLAQSPQVQKTINDPVMPEPATYVPYDPIVFSRFQGARESQSQAGAGVKRTRTDSDDEELSSAKMPKPGDGGET